MEMFLNACLPGLLPDDCSFQIRSYGGKHALLRKIGDRLNGYANWMPTNYRIVVVVDRDTDDCNDLKSRLEKICRDAGLRTRRTAGASNWQVVTRIAIEELEAWCFGDWPAVRKAYPRLSPNIPDKASYKNPDAIKGGTHEAFEKVLRQSGYFRQGLSKTIAANAIGKHLNPAQNKSHSFNVFRNAIAEVGA